MGKKQKFLHKIIAAITVTVMLMTALAGGIMIYMRNSSGRPKTITNALKHDMKANQSAMERPSKANRLHSTIGPRINSPEKVADQPDAKKISGFRKSENSTTSEPSGKIVYITFDDGPCSTTPQLLNVLDQCDVKATFFVTAQFMNDQDLVEQMKEIHRRGHKLAVHTYTHDYGKIYRSVSAFMEDYDKMDNLIYEAAGERSKIFRFPGGSNTGYNSAIRSELLAEVKNRGLIYHDWNAYDGDCDGYTGDDLIKRAVTECSYTDRAILLMHNIPGKETVIESMPEIIRQLRDAGYRFETMNDDMKPIQFS